MNELLQAVVEALRRYFNRQPAVLSIAEAEERLRPVASGVHQLPRTIYGLPVRFDRSVEPGTIRLTSDAVDAANGGVR